MISAASATTRLDLSPRNPRTSAITDGETDSLRSARNRVSFASTRRAFAMGQGAARKMIFPENSLAGSALPALSYRNLAIPRTPCDRMVTPATVPDALPGDQVSISPGSEFGASSTPFGLPAAPADAGLTRGAIRWRLQLGLFLTVILVGLGAAD